MPVESAAASSRAWCLTVWEADWAALTENHGKPDVEYFICQTEKAPDTGTLHVQGYVVFKRRKRMGGVKKYLGLTTAHLTVPKGSAADNKKYCSKEESRVDGWSTEYGDMPVNVGQGSRSDIMAVRDAMMGGASYRDIALEHFPVWIKYRAGIAEFLGMINGYELRELNITWIYGPPGCGKSRYAYDQCPMAYRPLLSQTGVWWDGYAGEDTMILDDLTGSCCPLSQLLRWMDQYPVRLSSKGASHPACWHTVFVTSQFSPTEIYGERVSGTRKAALRRRITSVMYRRTQDEEWVTTGSQGAVAP